MKPVLCYPHFTDEEIEVRREYITCPKTQLISDRAKILTLAAWAQSGHSWWTRTVWKKRIKKERESRIGDGFCLWMGKYRAKYFSNLKWFVNTGLSFYDDWCGNYHHYCHTNKTTAKLGDFKLAMGVGTNPQKAGVQNKRASLKEDEAEHTQLWTGTLGQNIWQVHMVLPAAPTGSPFPARLSGVSAPPQGPLT